MKGGPLEKAFWGWHQGGTLLAAAVCILEPATLQNVEGSGQSSGWQTFSFSIEETSLPAGLGEPQGASPGSVSASWAGILQASRAAV